jgi:hypothetical protein
MEYITEFGQANDLPQNNELWDEWEARYVITRSDQGTFTCTKTKWHGEYNVSDSTVETWTMLPENGREDYTREVVLGEPHEA